MGLFQHSWYFRLCSYLSVVLSATYSLYLPYIKGDVFQVSGGGTGFKSMGGVCVCCFVVFSLLTGYLPQCFLLEYYI